MRMRANQRRALTLLEVLIALLIFLLAVGAIELLSSYSGQRALEVQIQARASMRCQGKMAELIVGSESLNGSGGYTPFQDDFDKDLQWKADITSAGPADLYMVKVSVKAELPGGRVVESVLSQMILDPKVRGTTFDQLPPPPTSMTSGIQGR